MQKVLGRVSVSFTLLLSERLNVLLNHTPLLRLGVTLLNWVCPYSFLLHFVCLCMAAGFSSICLFVVGDSSDFSLPIIQISDFAANHKLKQIADCLKCVLADGFVPAIKLLT